MALQGEIPARVTLGYIENPISLGEEGGFDLAHNPHLVPHIPPDHPIVAEMSEPFTLGGFERPREPIVIGDADLSRVPDGIDIHNIPIKFPGTEYRVPNSLGYLSGALATCASVEHTINPAENDYFAYLTLERSKVLAGDTQRTSVVHSDGLQGKRVQPKVRTEHMYQAVDGFPPTFFIGALAMDGLDVDTHDLDKVFPGQVQTLETRVYDPNELVLFDTYNLHEGGRAPVPTMRTFFRLTYAVRQFNRRGNTTNALFAKEYEETGWEFQIRDKLTDLASPPAVES